MSVDPLEEPSGEGTPDAEELPEDPPIPDSAEILPLEEDLLDDLLEEVNATVSEATTEALETAQEQMQLILEVR